jgi:hypothetical protein
LVYDYYFEKIGRIRKANEIIIPVEDQKLEAPYAIELFFQIKVINYNCYFVRIYLIGIYYIKETSSSEFENNQ